MNSQWLKWRIMYTLHSPYARPNRMVEAYAGHIRPPDFLIIGTERGGTTSLHSYLTENPRIVRALRKEIHYFDQNYYKGRTWYMAHFPVRKKDILSGEASPHYYFFPEAAERIGKSFPDTKLIMLLRNPVDRAYSHYQHEVANGYEKLSFKDAIVREYNITDGIWKPRDLRANGISQYVHFSYLSKGIYVKHLKWWMAKIPRERFLILKSEAFFNNPGDGLSKVLNFLGLPPSDRSNFRKYNEGEYEPLDDKIRSQLLAFYAPYNDELSCLLDMDLRDWT